MTFPRYGSHRQPLNDRHVRRDHAEALALVERDMLRRNRVLKYVGAVLDTARAFFETVERCSLGKIV